MSKAFLKYAVFEAPDSMKIMFQTNSKKEFYDWLEPRPDICADQIAVDDCIILGFDEL